MILTEAVRIKWFCFCVELSDIGTVDHGACRLIAMGATLLNAALDAKVGEIVKTVREASNAAPPDVGKSKVVKALGRYIH